MELNFDTGSLLAVSFTRLFATILDLGFFRGSCKNF